jgi:hypothetical protein
MRVVLGLDVSTTCTGICVIDESFNVVKLDHVSLSKCNTLWDKADLIMEYFVSAKASFASGVTDVFIEESLQSFRPGFSSAATLTTLSKFNGLVSYFARQTFLVDPAYIAAPTARKACGVKLQNKKKCGIDHKEQVFQHISANELSNVVWPKKRNSEKFVDWSHDEVDAYVIAKAGMIRLLNGE